MDVAAWQTLAARALRPRRARWDECVAWLRGRCREAYDDCDRQGHRWVRLPASLDRHLACEAWETFVARGIVPEQWVGDPARCFVLASPVDGREVRLDHPGTASAAVALASDVEGLASAEALAREFLARAAPWRGAAPFVVAGWKVEGRYDAHRLGAYQPLARIHGALLVAAKGAVAASVVAQRRALGRAPPQLVRLAEVDAYWRYAVAEGLRVPALEWLPPDLGGTRFEDLPSPCPPLAELWATGYVPASFFDDWTRLVAPM